jgi:hypothetical protein
MHQRRTAAKVEREEAMLNRPELLALQAIDGYPAVTITLPTHRTSPDNRQDPIRLKNLVVQATERLAGEVGAREAAPLLRSLERLLNDFDHQHNLDGLAVFVNSDIARFERLPFTLPERVIVDRTFFTRDLVYAYNRSPHYWVLSLSEQPTRLYEAFRDDLTELNDYTPFPMTHDGRGGGQTLPSDPAINTSRLRDEHHRLFFRKVDAALSEYLARERLPIAVAGVDRYLSFFREVSANTGDIVAELQGNYDHISAHDLGRQIWPLVREGLAARRADVFGQLDVAIGGQRCASTIGEVYRFAREGRGALLLVEEGYHEPAVLAEDGFTLHLDAEGTGPELLDDAVDATIETVLAKGGRVVFVDDGSLDAHSRIALTLRY